MPIEKVVRKVSLKDQSNDFEYWSGKTYQERIAALEFLREQYIVMQKSTAGKNAIQGFQRILRITQRERS